MLNILLLQERARFVPESDLLEGPALSLPKVTKSKMEDVNMNLWGQILFLVIILNEI